MTQQQLVIDAVTWEEKSVKQIASETNILEPNIRRILGTGTKTWIFERIAPGIYTITIGDKTKCIIKCWDALQEIKKLSKAPYKFDMVFLDIPYKTAAVTWGNRWVKYDLITQDQFDEFLHDLKQVITPTTHVYHMYSNAPSWWKQMKAYNDSFEKRWFKLQKQWGWQKLYKNWKPCSNMRWEIMKREWLALYSLEDIDTSILEMDYESTRPRTASEKCSDMIRSLITQSTKVGQRILDPFAGTWVVWEQALNASRNAMLFEKSIDRVKNEILPRLTKIFSK